MKQFNAFLIGLILVVFAGCSNTEEVNKPKYIFYFIGDGMGPAQVTATQGVMALSSDSIGLLDLSFTNFPTRGMINTTSDNRFITGSAAAGTALSTGFKTSINTIGMNSDHTQPLKSVSYYAKESGKKVGIITSVSIDHATPAAFYAHQPHRSMAYEIAKEIVDTDFDYFAGGGFHYRKGKSGDLEDLYTIMSDKNYVITDTREGFDALSDTSQNHILFSPVMQGGASLPYAIDQNGSAFTIADYTRKGIELLNNDKGFFMMVEGGKIDWACHGNDFATMVDEVKDFSNAVQVAIDFYNKYPKETLIIVTADHETGGLSLGNNELHYDTRIQYCDVQKISLETFGNMLIDFKANKGSYSELKTIISDNFGLGADAKFQINEREQKILELAYKAYVLDDKDAASKFNSEVLYGSSNPIVTTVCNIINSRLGISWGSNSHTALIVPLYVQGAGHLLFEDCTDNTHIPNKIKSLLK